MKAIINGVEVEGTTQEIMQLWATKTESSPAQVIPNLERLPQEDLKLKKSKLTSEEIIFVIKNKHYTAPSIRNLFFQRYGRRIELNTIYSIIQRAKSDLYVGKMVLKSQKNPEVKAYPQKEIVKDDSFWKEQYEVLLADVQRKRNILDKQREIMSEIARLRIGLMKEDPTLSFGDGLRKAWAIYKANKKGE